MRERDPKKRHQRTRLRSKREPREQFRASPEIEKKRKELRKKYRERGLMGGQVPLPLRSAGIRYQTSKERTKELRVSKKTPHQDESIRARVQAVLDELGSK